MSIKIITPVATEPISLADAKAHLYVEIANHDTLISALIVAAREFAEHYTGRALAPQTLEMVLDRFPAGDITLERAPVTSITSVKYTDASGVERALASNAYALSTYGLSNRLSPGYAMPWPVARDVPDAVCVRYVAGYEPLPKAARSALLLLIGHLYENRQAASELKIEEMPLGVLPLLNTIKLWGRP
jgi:uncharacterized phiE125 gp8 family phage protein